MKIKLFEINHKPTTKLLLGLCFVLTLGLIACDNSEDHHVIGGNDSDLLSARDVAFVRSNIIQLLQEVEALKNSIEKENLLSFTASEDKDKFLSVLKRAQSALIVLNRDPFNISGYNILRTAIEQMKQVRIARGDMPLIDKLFTQLIGVTGFLSSKLGQPLSSTEWTLFAYYFGEGLSPFLSDSTGANWQTGFSLDRSYARIGGHAKAWLLSPRFDLTQVLQPSFQILHSIGINNNDRSDLAPNRPLILQSGFKAMVSTNYTNGNPEKATWTELSLGRLPSSYDFHTLYSAKVDLSAFRKPNVTVALLYDLDRDTSGGHYINWQLSSFTLYGSGVLNDIHPRKKLSEADNPNMIYLANFNDEDYEPNWTNQVVEGDPATWQLASFKGTQYYEISGFNNNNIGTQRIISPVIDLTQVPEATFSMVQTINHQSDLARQQKFIQIQAAQVSSDELKPEELEWLTLDLKKIPSGDNFDIVESEHLLLPNVLQQKKIVIGLKYRSIEGDSPKWQVHKVRVMKK